MSDEGSVAITFEPGIIKSDILRLSIKTLCRRAHTLQITTTDVLACATVAELQALAKARYRTLAKRYHPDAEQGRPPRLFGGQRPLTGRTFRQLTGAYEYLMELPSWQSISPDYWAPIPDYPVPGALERRPLNLTGGWQEVPYGW